VLFVSKHIFLSKPDFGWTNIDIGIGLGQMTSSLTESPCLAEFSTTLIVEVWEANDNRDG
jgi:hypothetical protein